MRGRQIQGCREVIADPAWSGTVRWRDHKGTHTARHRPDLAWLPDGRRVAIEVELAQKSAERLKAILGLHAQWRASGATGGVIYICGDPERERRVETAARRVGLMTTKGGGLRIESLETIETQTVASCDELRKGQADLRGPGHC